MNARSNFAISRCAGFMAAAAILAAFAALPAAAAPALPVAVTNTPTVNAHITNSSIGVGNTSDNPLFVDTGSTARNGFNASCFTGNVDATYGQASCVLLTVPAGRQVVIETVSCQAEVTTGTGPADVQLIVPNAPLGGGATTNVSHLLTLSRQAGDAALEIWRTTTSLRAYAASPATGAAGIGVFFRATYSPSEPVGMVCAISGYMAGQ
jgi:hypothetical protein